MKLTGLLKNKVEEAQTKEEKKAIIAEAGMELTDEELEAVAGGNLSGDMMSVGSPRIHFTCKDSKCRESFYIKKGASMVVCPKCQKKYYPKEDLPLSL